MSDLIAYELRSEYSGTVEQERDGQTIEVPIYQGGLLAVGDGDFNVGEELERGGGTIVIRARDQILADLLNAYPPLKQVSAPDAPAAIVSPYERRQTDDLRIAASLRDIDGHASAGRDTLIAALEVHDAAIDAGHQDIANDVQAKPIEISSARSRLEDAGAAVPAAASDESGGDPGDTSPPDPAPTIPAGGLESDQLVAVLDNDEETFAEAGRVLVPEALEELRRRAVAGDEEAQTGLESRGLNVDTNDAGNGGEEA